MEQNFSELILNIFPGLFFVYDISEGIEKARLLRFSKKWFIEKLGYSTEEVPGGYPEFIFSPSERERVAESLQKLIRDKYIEIELNTQHKAGYEIPYLYVANIITVEGTSYFIGYGNDISERKSTESVLRQREQYFKNIFNSSSDGIIVMDFDLNILNANNAIFKMFGYKFEDIAFQNVSNYLPEQIKQILESRKEKLFKGELLNPVELEIRKKIGGMMVPVEFNSIRINYGEFERILTTVRDITERKMYEKKIFNSEIYAEEKERERFAKELHDGLGPLLSACKIYLNSLSEMLDGQTELLNISDRALSLIDDALVNIKEISNNLSPHILHNFGLVKAVSSFVRKLSPLSGLEFDLKYNYDYKINEIVEFATYRTITELINNTIKYGKATKIKIGIYLNGNLLNVQYNDNGRGFDQEKIKKLNKGFGLLNIETRIKKFHSTFLYKTSPGNGVTVEFTLDTNH